MPCRISCSCHEQSDAAAIFHFNEYANQAILLTHVPDFAGVSTTINSGAQTSTAGTSEHTEGAFHEQVTDTTTNNAESVSELAIVAAMTTSTPVRTSTSNTQTDETGTNTEVNDETDDTRKGKTKRDNHKSCHLNHFMLDRD